MKLKPSYNQDNRYMVYFLESFLENDDEPSSWFRSRISRCCTSVSLLASDCDPRSRNLDPATAFWEAKTGFDRSKGIQATKLRMWGWGFKLSMRAREEVRFDHEKNQQDLNMGEHVAFTEPPCSFFLINKHGTVQFWRHPRLDRQLREGFWCILWDTCRNSAVHREIRWGWLADWTCLVIT